MQTISDTDNSNKEINGVGWEPDCLECINANIVYDICLKRNGGYQNDELVFL